MFSKCFCLHLLLTEITKIITFVLPFQLDEDGNYPPTAIEALSSLMINETFTVCLEVSRVARVDVVKHSFFYFVTPKWNSQPEHVVNQANFDIFFDLCKTYFSEN